MTIDNIKGMIEAIDDNHLSINTSIGDTIVTNVSGFKPM